MYSRAISRAFSRIWPVIFVTVLPTSSAVYLRRPYWDSTRTNRPIIRLRNQSSPRSRRAIRSSIELFRCSAAGPVERADLVPGVDSVSVRYSARYLTAEEFPARDRAERRYSILTPASAEVVPAAAAVAFWIC